MPHFGQFLKFLIKLTNDFNFKISMTALGILNRICSLATEAQLSSFSTLIVEAQIPKLGDSKIAVRQVTFQNLQIIMKVSINNELPYESCYNCVCLS